MTAGADRAAGLERAGRALTSLPARIAITAALLALVVRAIDWSTVRTALEGAAWGWFALAVITIVASFVVAALRWRVLLAEAAIPARYRQALPAYFVGAFANNLLPTGFGGDVVRAWMLAPAGRPLVRALTSVAVDRATALGCLVLVGWLGILIEPAAIPGRLAVLLAIATGAGAAGLVVAVALLRRQRVGGFLPQRLRRWAGESAQVLRAYLSDRRLQFHVLVLGILFQAMTVAAMWSLAETIGMEVEVGVLAVVTPLVLIATVAPISIAGFGVREGAFVVLLGEVGVSAAEATLLSLLSVAAMAIASLPGGLALLIRRERGEVPPEAIEPG